MSDKELEEYINKIEPNFDSHLEKGTIEMSDEYYNLLEEKMVRLINKNQKLKERIEYLERSNNRREDTILEQRQEISDLEDKWDKLKKYFNERIEVCNNRLSTPFCNFEKATKERLIFTQCLEKLEELEQGSDSNEI